MAKPRIRGKEARRHRANDRITAAEVISCPNLITDPDHYYTNGQCRCFTQGALEMREKGFTWTGFKWTPAFLVS